MTRRPTDPMPDDVADLLAEHGHMDACGQGPNLQLNDYLGRIGRAKPPETRCNVTYGEDYFYSVAVGHNITGKGTA